MTNAWIEISCFVCDRELGYMDHFQYGLIVYCPRCMKQQELGEKDE